jgi:hypothetical protein
MVMTPMTRMMVQSFPSQQLCQFLQTLMSSAKPLTLFCMLFFERDENELVVTDA